VFKVLTMAFSQWCYRTSLPPLLVAFCPVDLVEVWPDDGIAFFS
jgi:hypothetical protein